MQHVVLVYHLMPNKAIYTLAKKWKESQEPAYVIYGIG